MKKRYRFLINKIIVEHRFIGQISGFDIHREIEEKKYFYIPTNGFSDGRSMDGIMECDFLISKDILLGNQGRIED